jgi:ComF family protein
VTTSSLCTEALAWLWQVVLSPAIEALAPSRCAACGEELPGAQLFCDACRAEDPIQGPSAPLQVSGVPVFTMGPFEGKLRQAITRLKYENHPELAAPIAATLWRSLGCQPIGPDAVLVPVPLHPKRFADRGYNQSALLAQELSALSGLRASPRGLCRVTNTEQQARLKRKERLQNLSAQIVPGKLGSGEKVVLVDDVFTTGGTAAACIEAIRAAGSEPVLVVAVALTPHSSADKPQPRILRASGGVTALASDKAASTASTRR